MPSLIADPYSFAIRQTVDRVVLTYEKDDIVRAVWLAGHGHPERVVKGKFMDRFCAAVLFIAGLGMTVPNLEARPEFLMRFQSDPFRIVEVDGCSVCHENPNGGGPRNVFGQAFEAAGYVITPLMRVDFPDRFDVETAELADGSVVYLSDPASEFVVVRRAEEEEKFVIDLGAVASGAVSAPPDRGKSLSFFVTSVGMGDGGNLGGLAGADQHCQSLADAAGSGDREWHAYLSTSFDQEPMINAGDRIGSGPWYNANGILIARGVTDLHTGGSRLGRESALDEDGNIVPGIGDENNLHDMLTGSLTDGTSAIGMNCNNWTSNGEGSAMAGHHDLLGGGGVERSWNSVHVTQSCSQTGFQATGGSGLFYCFAID